MKSFKFVAMLTASDYEATGTRNVCQIGRSVENLNGRNCLVLRKSTMSVRRDKAAPRPLRGTNFTEQLRRRIIASWSGLWDTFLKAVSSMTVLPSSVCAFDG